MMAYVLSVRLFLICIFLELATGDVYYAAEFTDSVLSCSDFENDAIKADEISLGILDESDNGEAGFGLSGPLDLNIELNDDHFINLDVYKDTEVGSEYVFNSKAKLCPSLKQEDAPWTPVVKMMNISGCPVGAGSYPLKDLVLSVEPFEGLLTRDFCGDYAVQLAIMDELDKKACFVVQVAIVEKESE